MTIGRKFLSVRDTSWFAKMTIPPSKHAAEKEQDVVIKKEDLRKAILTNPLVYRAVDIRSSLIVARGYKLRFENDKVENCIKEFLKNIRKNDPFGSNLNMMIRAMAFDTDVWGNGYRLLVPNNSNKKIVSLKALHPIYVDLQRDPSNKIKIDEQGIPVGFKIKDVMTGKDYEKPRAEVSHLIFHVLGDEFLGIPTLMPVYNAMERLTNIEESMAQACYKHAWPLYDVLLKETDSFIPSEEAIKQVSAEIEGMSGWTEFVHGPEYEVKVLNPDWPRDVWRVPTYFIDMIVSATGVPKHVLLGEGRYMTRATAEALQSLMNPLLEPLQEQVKTMTENQIFRRILDKEGIDGSCTIEWNEIITERDDRIAEKLNLLSTTYIEGRPIITWDEAREMLRLPTTTQPEKVLLEAQTKMQGVYLEPEHGELIWKGRKKAIVKTIEYKENIGIPVILVSGKKAYGVIRLDSPKKMDLKEFKDMYFKHHISEEERLKWSKTYRKWKSGPFFYYPITVLERFSQPKRVDVPKGIQFFIREVKFAESSPMHIERFRKMYLSGSDQFDRTNR